VRCLRRPNNCRFEKYELGRFSQIPLAQLMNDNEKDCSEAVDIPCENYSSRAIFIRVRANGTSKPSRAGERPFDSSHASKSRIYTVVHGGR
jgi:hypothetical protein